MLVGLGMVVVLSPVLAWYAQSQHRAEDFGTAIQVESTSAEEGYVVVEDQAVNDDRLDCPFEGMHLKKNTAKATESCVAVVLDKEVYERTEKEECGAIQSDQTIIRNLPDRCDTNGDNCERCYLVEEMDWASDVAGSSEEYAAFTLGDYSVRANETTNFIDLQELTEYETQKAATKPRVGDVRYNYAYLPSDQELLVAGDAEDNTIVAAYDDKPFVVSTKSYQGTLEALEAQDNSAKWGLRIASLIAMTVGMILVFGPLTLFTNIFRVIPLVGKHIDNGFDGVLKFFAVLIGLLLWAGMYLVVLLIKNILAVIIVLAALGVAAFFLVQKGRKETPTTNME